MKGEFVDKHDLIRMIDGKEATRFVKQYATDMMMPGAIIELIKDYFPEAIFDKLGWTFHVHFSYRMFYIRLVFNALLDPTDRAESLIKIALHNFENELRNEFDYVDIERGACSIFAVGMSLELGRRFPIKVVDNCKQPNILERIFGV